MHSSGQNFAVVRHQNHAAGVVPAEIVETIGKLLAAREMVAEIREAARHRIAADLDHFRIWQNEMNEPDMQEIVRHLVHEMRPPLSAVNARTLQILCTQCTAGLI